MKDEYPTPKLQPKGEVLRRLAQRYPNLPMGAMEVFLSVKQVAQENECAHREALEAHGLSDGRFYVLADLFSEALLGHDAPSPSDIAEHLGVTRATITGLLDGLERDGFLERCPDRQDRRALTVHMTDKARQFLDEYLPQTFHRLSASMTGLTKNEMQTLIELLAKIKTISAEASISCRI